MFFLLRRFFKVLAPKRFGIVTKIIIIFKTSKHLMKKKSYVNTNTVDFH